MVMFPVRYDQLPEDHFPMKSQFDDTSHSFHGSMITATNGSRFYAFEIEWSTPMAEDLETKLSSSIEPWWKHGTRIIIRIMGIELGKMVA